MLYEIKQDAKFKFIEEGEGEPLILLHGLFGALSNFEGIIEYFRHHNKVIVPLLPLFDLDLLHSTVGGLEKYVHKVGQQQVPAFTLAIMLNPHMKLSYHAAYEPNNVRDVKDWFESSAANGGVGVEDGRSSSAEASRMAWLVECLSSVRPTPLVANGRDCSLLPFRSPSNLPASSAAKSDSGKPDRYPGLNPAAPLLAWHLASS